MREELQLLDIGAKQAAWDATIQTNIDHLTAMMRFIDPTIESQGGIATPSSIVFQLCDGKGVAIAEVMYLRVRVCDDGDYANASTGTIAAGSGTALVSTYTAGKDLLFKSDANGIVRITYTNGIASTKTLRVGPSELSAVFANYHKSLDITHA